jgi:hypothetical protein
LQETSCRASGARHDLLTFPSAAALGYPLDAPPALFKVVPRILIAEVSASRNHLDDVEVDNRLNRTPTPQVQSLDTACI